MHISDLHFGKVDPKVRDGLKSDIESLKPSALAISGDLTQRARVSQFEEFCEFMGQFSVPKIVVPGNHDIPLFDVFRRFMSPLKRFRSHVESDLMPTYEDEHVFILGVNTAHSWTFSGGKLSTKAAEKMNEAFRRSGPEKLRILVCHHPLHTEDRAGSGWVGGIHHFKARIDLVLTGHLHLSANEILMHEHGTESTKEKSVILVRAGTAISHRHRGETNSYNLIHASRDQVLVERRVWDPVGSAFVSGSSDKFHRINGIFERA
jgi:3',5'-cyclic AMP phosphodiesterase CpdA